MNFDNIPNDVIILLALEFNDKDILNYCKTNKRFNRLICQNWDFWYQKILKEFKYDAKVKDLDKIKTLYGNLSSINRYIEEKKSSLDEQLVKYSQGDSLETIKYLIDRGAKVDTDWNEPIRNAISKGNVDIVKFLVE